jgi:hypothetical protein
VSVERGWRWEEEVRREKRARNTKRQTRTMIRDVPPANKLLGKLWGSKKSQVAEVPIARYTEVPKRA